VVIGVILVSKDYYEYPRIRFCKVVIGVIIVSKDYYEYPQIRF
jgi:hypothetical protein